MIDAQAAQQTADNKTSFFSGTSVVHGTIADSAKLYLHGARGNNTYLIAANTTTNTTTNAVTNQITIGGWGLSSNNANGLTDAENLSLQHYGNAKYAYKFSNLIWRDKMMNYTLQNDSTGTNLIVTAKARNAADVYHGIGAVNIMNEVWSEGHNWINSADASLRFLSRVNDEELYLADSKVVPTVNSAMQLAVVAGALTNQLAVSGTAQSRIQSHLSDGFKAEQGINGGEAGLPWGLWAEGLYGHSNTFGFESKTLDGGVKSDFGGVILGMDYAITDELTAGLALNVGGGTSHSTGDYNSSTDNFNFWGVSLYSGWSHNNIGIMADFGYSSTKHDLSQDLPKELDFGNLNGEMDSYALTAGLAAEYIFATDYLNITPHAGVRYTNLHSQSYDVDSAQGTVFEVDSATQNIFSFPVGIRFSKDFESASGWNFNTKLDVGATFNTGDVEAESTVSIPHRAVAAKDSVKMEILEPTVYNAALGVNVGKGVVNFGLEYTLQTSEHRADHGVNATFRYEF